MALIKCIECEKMISEYAVVCPNCGCPMNIIVEKSKKEIRKTVIDTKKTLEPSDDLLRYRSLCKFPNEILEQIHYERDKDNHESKEKDIEQDKTKMLKTVQVGESIYFGTYNQDGNSINWKQKIEWIVLAKENSRILLLSKYALDCKPYHTRTEKITWEKCTLRSWLNNDFMNATFTEKEKNMIPLVTVMADKNPYYKTNPGKATKDKVFLLSTNEVERYFSSDEQRKCKATRYAQNRGLYVNNNIGVVRWWLRTPGYTQNDAMYIDCWGYIRVAGRKVDDTVENAVRPALWINLKE